MQYLENQKSQYSKFYIQTKPLYQIYRTPIRLHFHFQFAFQNLLITQIYHLLYHSPFLISLLRDKYDKNGYGFWKFNDPFVYDEVYAEKMKDIIAKISNSNEFMENAQTKWEFVKKETGKFTIHAVTQWLSLLYNFIQLSLNSGLAQV